MRATAEAAPVEVKHVVVEKAAPIPDANGMTDP